MTHHGGCWEGDHSPATPAFIESSPLLGMTARWAAERERASNAPVSLDALRAGAGNASSSSLRANHSFLSNTLHAVGGHNRRVEEGVCWNTKRLIDAVPRGRGAGDAEAEAAAARAKKRVASFQFEHGHYEVDDAASAGAAGSSGAAGLSTARRRRAVAPSRCASDAPCTVQSSSRDRSPHVSHARRSRRSRRHRRSLSLTSMPPFAPPRPRLRPRRTAPPSCMTLASRLPLPPPSELLVPPPSPSSRRSA